MRKPILVIMAAGMGSRYGGLKQLDPMGPGGEFIMDYSLYDALRAGFGKVVFIIKEEIEELFREKIGDRIDKITDTEYVFQSLEDVPPGFAIPEGRVKPWGTAHAILSSRHVVDRPFAVINADDYYGRQTFELLHDFLLNADSNARPYQCCMVGFDIKNTLTEHGHVARGVCTLGNDGYLSGIQERTKIQRFGEAVRYTENDGESWIDIPSDSIVSMNAWGFTPGLFDEFLCSFTNFLETNKSNTDKVEFFIALAIDNLISKGLARVKVLQSNERWYGVTYQEDKLFIKQAFEKMIHRGDYPYNLWGGHK